LKGTLENAIAACEASSKAKGISVVLQANEKITAMVNPALLEQAVVNLLDNAIKYSESGSTVEISCSSSGTEAIISVRDRGCGIEKKHLPRLFERFYRVDKSRSRELGGTGLGLAIVKHIVLAHRGRVSVQSVYGEGSTFTIHLPISGGQRR